MKVHCPSCSASFLAPDDKIRGRIVKYRCRKCGGTIAADGTTLIEGESDSTQVMAQDALSGWDSKGPPPLPLSEPPPGAELITAPPPRAVTDAPPAAEDVATAVPPGVTPKPATTVSKPPPKAAIAPKPASVTPKPPAGAPKPAAVVPHAAPKPAARATPAPAAARPTTPRPPVVEAEPPAALPTVEDVPDASPTSVEPIPEPLAKKAEEPKPLPPKPAKRPLGDASAAFQLVPADQGAADEPAVARRKPRSMPPPHHHVDEVVAEKKPAPPPPAADGADPPRPSGLADLAALADDLIDSSAVEAAPPSSGRVNFDALLGEAPKAGRVGSGDFDWGGSLESEAPAPLWTAPVMDLTAATAPEPEPTRPAKAADPVPTISPVAAKAASPEAPPPAKRSPVLTYAVIAAVAGGVVFLGMRLSSSGESADTRDTRPAATAKDTKDGTQAPPTDTAKTAQPTATATADPAPSVTTTATATATTTTTATATATATTTADPGEKKPVVAKEPTEPKEPVAKDPKEPVAKDPKEPVAKDPKEPEKKDDKPPPPVDVGAEFNKDAARAALGAAASAAAGCKQEDGPTGTASVRVTFVPSGRSTQAVVQGPPFAGTATGSCIASKFRGLSVPPFSGDPVSVSKSVTIN